MTLEQVGIDIQAVGAAQFARDVKATEFALRQQAKALNESAIALQTEITELKNSADPNRELIKSKQALLNQTRANSAEVKASISAIREQGQAYRDTTGAVNEHKSALATVGSVIATAATGTLKLIGIISTLVTGYELLKKVSTSNQEVGKVFDTVSIGAQKANKFLGSVIDGASKFIGSLKGFATPAGVAVGALGAVAIGALGVAAAFTVASLGINAIIGAFESFINIIPNAISAGREFETQMRSVSTAMSGTDADVKKLGDQLLGLSTKLNVPAVELASAEYEILSAGISDAGLAFEATEQSAKLAKAGLSTVAEAANLVTSAINAYGEGPTQAANILFKTIQDGKTTAAGLSQSFGLVAGSAQSAGVSFIELNAATAALTLTGQTASTAQNNLRQAIANITQPSEDAKKVAKALGLEFNGAALQSKGLTEFLSELKAKVGENKTALGQLFGSVEAYNAIVKLTGVSQQDYLRILGDLNNASGSLDVAFAKQRDSVGALGNAINNELIKAGRNILTQFNPVIEKLIDLFFKAGSAGKAFIDSIRQVVTEVARLAADFLKLGLALIGLNVNLDGAALSLKSFAVFLDMVSTAGEITAHVLGTVANAALKMASLDFAGAFKAAASIPGYLNSKTSAFSARTAARFTEEKESGIPAAKPPAPKGNSDPTLNKEINTKKEKKGKSESQIERERIQDVQRSYEHQIAQMRDSSELSIKQQGPFADQGNLLKAKLTEEQSAAALLGRELIKLQNTSVKTADGKRALNEAINKTKDDLAKEKVSIQEASNAWEKYKVETKETDFKRKADLQVASIQYVTDQTIKGEEEQAAVEAQAYANKKVSINDYYAEVQDHIRNKAAAEQAAYEQTNKLIDDEIELLKKLEGIDESNPKIKDLRASQQKLYMQNESVQAGYTSLSDAAKQQLKQDLTQASRDFGQALQGDISQALQDAFSGSNPLQVIKNFAKSLYNTIVQSLSQALAAGFAKSQIFQQITDSVGNLINKLSKNTNQGSSGGGSIGSAIKSIFSKGQTTISPKLGDITGGQGIPFIDPTGGQGVPFVAQQAPAAGGALAAAAFAIPLMAAQSAIAKGGTLGQKYVNFIDPLNFRKLLGFGGSTKAQKQAKRDEYHQNVLAPYLNNVVQNANPDNLDDLNTSFLQAARGMKSNGSSGQALKQQAMTQILDLIAKRQKAIDDFIKTTKTQNEDLQDSIALADAKPIEKAGMERAIELKKIQRDTDALLEQYKDSEAAKTEILKTEALKRQELLQQEQEDFKSKTQDLAELLKQRDDIANANVFTRLRSPEQVKADQLSQLDTKIAQAALELKGMQNAGEGASSLGSNQILAGVNALTQNNNLQITINESNDPTKTQEAITRALAALNLKVYGATA